jgi:uncharacterized integral membrane protein
MEGIEMRKTHKAQNAIIYAALIAFVAGALLLMFVYIQRRVQGTYKQAADAYGQGEQH